MSEQQRCTNGHIFHAMKCVDCGTPQFESQPQQEPVVSAPIPEDGMDLVEAIRAIYVGCGAHGAQDNVFNMPSAILCGFNELKAELTTARERIGRREAMLDKFSDNNDRLIERIGRAEARNAALEEALRAIVENNVLCFDDEYNKAIEAGRSLLEIKR